ncbi:fimbrial protein [Lelliottia sp. CFBP8978]|uniref:fimbrial protein n=1 Tax=Lelliottia sp. CFBP8978 TaxID=3096522 RepID=UPI002A6B60B6|nr:fimbrial protein [Lelliottia sp. CFBP8978]
MTSFTANAISNLILRHCTVWIEMMMRYFFVLLLILGFSSHSWACEGNGARVSTIRLQFAMKDILAQKKIGDILYSQRATLSDLTKSSDELACSDKLGVLNVTGILAGREVGKRVYQTSVPGIGIRIFYYNNQPGIGNTLKAIPFNDISVVNKNKPLRPENITLKIELVKTGPIASVPVLLFHQAALLRFAVKNDTTIVNLQLMATLPETVCNFDSQQTVFHLPAQPAASISERKTHFRYPIPVKISCNGEPHLMTVTLNGDAYDASQGIFNIENVQGSAQGVGVQFWYRALPIRTGKPLQIFSPGRLTVNNQIILPFFVSYVRTKNDITPGRISVGAVLHIDYL